MNDEEYKQHCFLRNVKEAREFGYDTVCASCGVGVSWDDMDIHEDFCKLCERKKEE